MQGRDLEDVEGWTRELQDFAHRPATATIATIAGDSSA